MSTVTEDWVNLSEYGRQRGCSSQSVKFAIEDGRLKKSVRRKVNGKWEVLPAAANIEWDISTKNQHRPSTLAQNFPTGEPVKPHGAVDNVTPDKMALFEAQRRHEAAKAETAEMKLAELRGQLINADSVKATAFDLARTVRDGMLNIPDRVAAEFAGMTQAFDIHKRLTEEIHKTLEGLATL